MRRGRSARAVGLAAVAATVAGCAGIPATSAPHAIESVQRGAVFVEPEPRFQIDPDPGDSPQTIAAKFLATEGSAAGQHFQARQFLTPEAAKSWDDSAGAVVLAKSPYTSQDDNSVVTIRAGTVARIDRGGSYIADDHPYQYHLHMQQVRGEWRIANPPSGVVITRAEFQAEFQAINVYFLDQAEHRAVPDRRWYLAPSDSLPNLALRALLRGPSAGIAGAVRTALGQVQLSGNVVLDGGRLKVFLTGFEQVPPDERAAAVAQIVLTLTGSTARASDVQLFNDNQALSLAGLPDVQHRAEWSAYLDDNLTETTPGYYVRDGAVRDTDGRAWPGPAGTGAYHARSVAVTRDLTGIAVVGTAPGGVGLFVGRGSAPLTKRLAGSRLTTPTYDPTTGDVWTVRGQHEVMRVPADAPPVGVEGGTALAAAGPISALRLSPDGCRVAIIAGPAGNQSLYLGAVVRTSQITISPLMAVAGLQNVVAVSWQRSDTVLVLTRGGSSDVSIHSIPFDGSSDTQVTTSGLPGPPTALAALADLPILAVAEGGVWELAGLTDSDWSSVARSGRVDDSEPAYPG